MDQRKLERFRDFFDLQLRFAEVISAKTAIPIADAVLTCTNLHRRFGLGDPPEGTPSPRWQAYVDTLSKLETHQQRADWTQATYAASPDEESPIPDQVFGCFEYFADAVTGIVRFHFYNRDPEGPLQQHRIERRRRELRSLFAHVKSQYPTAAIVQGRSWLYGTQAYRRLFPENYVQSAEIIESDLRFQGMSRWGQFLDHKGNVKAPLRSHFIRNLDVIVIDRLWAAFPLPCYRASAPIAEFYEHFDI